MDSSSAAADPPCSPKSPMRQLTMGTSELGLLSPATLTPQDSPSSVLPEPERSRPAGSAAAFGGEGVSWGSKAPRPLPHRRHGHWQTAEEPQPAQYFFRDFKVLDKIGEGRFGSVWRCINRVTGAELACKQIMKDKGSKSFRREVECFARVQTHSNVLRLEGVYESEQCVYVCTELCNSGDLFDAIGDEGALLEEEAQDVLRQLTSAVRHCHARGVLHRDLKPENVLLHTCPATGQMMVKLADFGLATRLEVGETAVGWVGSEPYEAPEVIALKPYNHSADVFSLGVVLYGMLSGTWPSFAQGRRFDPEEDFAWPGWQAMSAEAKDLITRMLDFCPLRRPMLYEILRHPWLTACSESETASIPVAVALPPSPVPRMKLEVEVPSPRGSRVTSPNANSGPSPRARPSVAAVANARERTESDAGSRASPLDVAKRRHQRPEQVLVPKLIAAIQSLRLDSPKCPKEPASPNISTTSADARSRHRPTDNTSPECGQKESKLRDRTPTPLRGQGWKEAKACWDGGLAAGALAADAKPCSLHSSDSEQWSSDDDGSVPWHSPPPAKVSSTSKVLNAPRAGLP